MYFLESLHLLADTLWWIKSKEDFSGALEDVLTPSEITEIADRIRILKMLKSGESQRTIAEKLGVSVTTVSRGNRILQYSGKSIREHI